MPSEDQSSKRRIEWFRPFGRTGLRTSCLAIGGGGMISSEDVLYAFDKGINTFFFSSDLHHFAYKPMVDALKKLCGRSSSRRDEVNLFTVTYGRHPRMILSMLFDQFAELRMDGIDMLYWGWNDAEDQDILAGFLNRSPQLVGPKSAMHQGLERLFGATERMKKHGAIRHLGASFHSVELAQAALEHPALEGAMVRFNVAHRRAAQEFFPHLPERAQRPGVMTFKSMASIRGPLWTKPAGWTHEWTPEPADLYRYVLSQPDVDVVLMGPMNRRDIDQAVAAVDKGVMSQEELELCAAWGDAHRGRTAQSQPPPPAPPSPPRAKRAASKSKSASKAPAKARKAQVSASKRTRKA